MCNNSLRLTICNIIQLCIRVKCLICQGYVSFLKAVSFFKPVSHMDVRANCHKQSLGDVCEPTQIACVN